MSEVLDLVIFSTWFSRKIKDSYVIEVFLSCWFSSKSWFRSAGPRALHGQSSWETCHWGTLLWMSGIRGHQNEKNAPVSDNPICFCEGQKPENKTLRQQMGRMRWRVWLIFPVPSSSVSPQLSARRRSTCGSPVSTGWWRTLREHLPPNR